MICVISGPKHLTDSETLHSPPPTSSITEVCVEMEGPRNWSSLYHWANPWKSLPDPQPTLGEWKINVYVLKILKFCVDCYNNTTSLPWLIHMHYLTYSSKVRLILLWFHFTDGETERLSNLSKITQQLSDGTGLDSSTYIHNHHIAKGAKGKLIIMSWVKRRREAGSKRALTARIEKNLRIRRKVGTLEKGLRHQLPK